LIRLIGATLKQGPLQQDNFGADDFSGLSNGLIWFSFWKTSQLDHFPQFQKYIGQKLRPLRPHFKSIFSLLFLVGIFITKLYFIRNTALFRETNALWRAKNRVQSHITSTDSSSNKGFMKPTENRLISGLLFERKRLFQMLEDD
jgi:hypothetical protein